jgi:hypothetical protein
MTTTAKQIGSIIKSKRVEKNLTQKQLAVLCFKQEMYQGFICRVEKGQLKDIRFDDVRLILGIFEIDLMKLITNKN